MMNLISLDFNQKINNQYAVNCKGDLLRIINITFFRRIVSVYNYTKEKFENYNELDIAFYEYNDEIKK